MNARRFVVAFCLLAACGNEVKWVPATQVVVTLHSDLGPTLANVVVTVYDPREERKGGSFTFRLSETVTLPLSFSVVPTADTTTQFLVAASGRDDKDVQIVEAKVVASFVRNQTVGLELWLLKSCTGVDCGPGQTCARSDADAKAECAAIPIEAPVLVTPGQELDGSSPSELEGGGVASDAAPTANLDGGPTGGDAGPSSDAAPMAAMDSGTDARPPAGGDAGPTANDGGRPTDGSATEAGASVDSGCNPADRLPEATPIVSPGTGVPPAGRFATAVESDPGIAGYTILRPEPLGMIKHPVLTWGNGGCMKNNGGFLEFLLQLAAEGIVVIADGTPSGTGTSPEDGSQLIKALDWAAQENARPCSKYYQKLDLTKIAVAGQSCGGLMAFNAAADRRVTTSMPMNSGLTARNPTLYAALHAPMAIVNGGSSDVAFVQANADFEAINTIPIMHANIDVGHIGTLRQDNGGEMGKMAIAWLRWHLLKDDGATGKGMFIGASCGFCNTTWTMQWKMKPP